MLSSPSRSEGVTKHMVGLLRMTHSMFNSPLPLSSLPIRRQTLGRMVSASMATLLFVTGVLIIMLAMLILFNENHNATKGYKLRTLERERSQLLLTEEVLKMHIAQAQALETMFTDPIITSMLPVVKPQYVKGEAAAALE